jgi:hypothetical protein
MRKPCSAEICFPASSRADPATFQFDPARSGMHVKTAAHHGSLMRELP